MDATTRQVKELGRHALPALVQVFGDELAETLQLAEGEEVVFLEGEPVVHGEAGLAGGGLLGGRFVVGFVLVVVVFVVAVLVVLALVFARALCSRVFHFQALLSRARLTV